MSVLIGSFSPQRSQKKIRTRKFQSRRHLLEPIRVEGILVRMRRVYPGQGYHLHDVWDIGSVK